jgi:hypothetical protein
MLVSDPVSCPSLLVSRAWSCATLSAWLLLLISTPVYCATLWALSYCHIANRQPIQTSQINELDTPNSNYRTLRDEDNIYYYHDLSNGDLNYIQWEPSMIKIHINKSHIIGTDGDDSFDVDYYNNHNFFDRSCYLACLTRLFDSFE